MFVEELYFLLKEWLFFLISCRGGTPRKKKACYSLPGIEPVLLQTGKLAIRLNHWRHDDIFFLIHALWRDAYFFYLIINNLDSTPWRLSAIVHSRKAVKSYNIRQSLRRVLSLYYKSSALYLCAAIFCWNLVSRYTAESCYFFFQSTFIMLKKPSVPEY